MVTKRKSEFEKARGDARRGLARMVGTLPLVARLNWRNVVMPWRMLPAPVALALIALVALAMVLDTGENAEAFPLEGAGVTIGGDTVTPGTRCAEDEVITYLALLGGEGVGCVHYEYVVMQFLNDCIIGNSQHGGNLASWHLRDPAFRSWCDTVIDDASDGMVSLADMLIDLVSTVEPSPSPTVTATAIDATPTVTPGVPKSLPSTGSR